jgi:glucose-6-phosphate 1-epimerase
MTASEYEEHDAERWMPAAELTEGPGGLALLRLTTAGGVGEVFLNGAHLASWTPRGHRPVLWMSDRSRFTDGLPLRGGVPICFPWFNRHSEHPDAPQHGFARIQPWALDDVAEHDGSIRAVFRLTDSGLSRVSIWPYRFEAMYTVTLGEELCLELEVENRDDVEFGFEAALHSYYAVGDVRMTRVHGLTGLEFSSEGSSVARENSPVKIGAGISRRYPVATSARIEDVANNRAITISSEGASGAVLWNPGPAEASAIPDFADDGWSKMLCFENCNIGVAMIRLEPGARHRMRTLVSVSPL